MAAAGTHFQGGEGSEIFSWKGKVERFTCESPVFSHGQQIDRFQKPRIGPDLRVVRLITVECNFREYQLPIPSKLMHTVVTQPNIEVQKCFLCQICREKLIDWQKMRPGRSILGFQNQVLPSLETFDTIFNLLFFAGNCSTYFKFELRNKYESILGVIHVNVFPSLQDDGWTPDFQKHFIMRVLKLFQGNHKTPATHENCLNASVMW